MIARPSYPLFPMRLFLLSLLAAGALAVYAQNHASPMVPKKAVVQLEKLRKQTKAVVVIDKSRDKLPPEARSGAQQDFVAVDH